MNEVQIKTNQASTPNRNIPENLPKELNNQSIDSLSKTISASSIDSINSKN